MKTKHWIFFGAILVLALGLRLYSAGSREIFYDDAFSFFLSQQSLGKIVAGTAADTMPPLYYFLLHYWLRLGESIFVLRLLGVMFSLGMIVVVFDLGRRLAGVAAGLWAALILAVAPFQIYHAQELRMYTLLGLAQISYVWFFVRVREKSPSKHPAGLWAGLILTGTAAMYSHNLAIFGLILPDIYLLLKRDWRMLLKLVLAQLVIALFTAPWLVMIPGQIDKIQTAFWTPLPGLVEVLQGILQFHIFLPMEGPVMLIATLFSLQAMVLVGYEVFKARKLPGVGLLSLLWIGLPVILFAVSYAMRPIFVPRGFILSMLAYAVLGGWMISRRWVKSIGPYLAAACIMASLISLPAFYQFSGFPRSEFRNATAFLRQNMQKGDAILHDNKLSYFPSHFYAPGLEQTFLPDEPGGHNDTFANASQKAMSIFPAVSVEQAVGDHERVWFVVFTRAIQEYAEGGMAIHPVMAQLDTQYYQISQKAFGDLEIYLYQR